MQLTIPHRFCGPPESGNGGWVSGALAEHVATTAHLPAVTVRLAAPPPLDRALDVVTDTAHDGPATVRLVDGGHLVATASAATAPSGPVPARVPLDEARSAEQRFEGLAAHPFPTCFACGTGRDPEDGLCLRPGPLDDGTGRYATSWVPREKGTPIAWAALDCPGGWSAGIAGRPMVLGTMTAHVAAPVAVGEPHVVVSWQRGSEGRKHHSGSALFSADGALLARSEATWIAVDPTTIRPQDRS